MIYSGKILYVTSKDGSKTIKYVASKQDCDIYCVCNDCSTGRVKNPMLFTFKLAANSLLELENSVCTMEWKVHANFCIFINLTHSELNLCFRFINGSLI